jgi:hydrogenase nickel incorporation protein HypA/HybF
MHELSIALGIVDVAAEALARNGGGRVEAVHLKLGPLSGVIKAALLSAYELATEESLLAGSHLEIEDVPVEINCPICRAIRPVQSIQQMRCRECGTLCADIVRGRELEVVALEIVDEQPAPIG